MNNEKVLEQMKENLLSRVVDLDFSFFDSEADKIEKIDKEKNFIINQVKSIVNMDYIDESFFSQLWENAEFSAKKNFNKIDKKIQLNGFYFQEIIHIFIENIFNKLQGRQ